MVPAAALGGNAGPSLRLSDPLSTAARSFPTQSVVQGILDPNNSSSSSHVWKLGIDGLPAGQVANPPVGRLWVVSASPVSTRGHLDGCAPSPSVVHPLSPASPRSVPSRLDPRSESTLGPGRGLEAEWRPRRSDARKHPEAGGGRGPVDVRRASGGAPGGEPGRSPQPVHIPGDNFSTSRPTRFADRVANRARRAHQGCPRTTGAVDKDEDRGRHRRAERAGRVRSGRTQRLRVPGDGKRRRCRPEDDRVTAGRGS